MMGNHFSIILLPTNKCNVNCEYCFENKTDDRRHVESVAASLALNRSRQSMAGAWSTSSPGNHGRLPNASTLVQIQSLAQQRQAAAEI